MDASNRSFAMRISNIFPWLLALAIAASVEMNASAQEEFTRNDVAYRTGVDLDVQSIFSNIGGQIIGDEFTLPIDANITQIRWWGNYRDYSLPDTKKTVEFSIKVCFDLAGLPNESDCVFDNLLEARLQRVAGKTNAQYIFEIDVDLEIVAKVSYWLIIAESDRDTKFICESFPCPPDVDTNHQWVWNQSGSTDSYVARNTNPEHLIDWHRVGDPDLAFQLFTQCDENTDIDGDNLCDFWEIVGFFDWEHDQFVDLPAMGADPYIRDLFLEIDYLKGQTNSEQFRISAKSIKLVQDAFNNAPCKNLAEQETLSQCGIHLHVDHGESFQMWSGVPWSKYSDAEEIKYKENIVATDSNFNSLESSNGGDYFKPWRESIFYYGIAVDTSCEKTESCKGESKTNECNCNGGWASKKYPHLLLPKRTRMNSECATASEKQPQTYYFADREFRAAYSLMHEIGHLLGLEHGGKDAINNKPNYISVMNYAFVKGLIYKPDASASKEKRIDYSRVQFNSLFRDSVFESSGMDETFGERSEGRNAEEIYNFYKTIHFCVKEVQDPISCAMVQERQQDYISEFGNISAIDWNCTGVIDLEPFPYDISGKPGKSTPNELSSYNDWLKIKFAPTDVKSAQAKLSTFELTTDEDDDEEFLPIALYDHCVSVMALSANQVIAGSMALHEFRIKNCGTQDDNYQVDITHSAQWEITHPASVLMLKSSEAARLSIDVRVPDNAMPDDLETLTLSVSSLAQEDVASFDKIDSLVVVDQTLPDDGVISSPVEPTIPQSSNSGGAFSLLEILSMLILFAISSVTARSTSSLIPIF